MNSQLDSLDLASWQAGARFWPASKCQGVQDVQSAKASLHRSGLARTHPKGYASWEWMYVRDACVCVCVWGGGGEVEFMHQQTHRQTLREMEIQRRKRWEEMDPFSSFCSPISKGRSGRKAGPIVGRQLRIIET